MRKILTRVGLVLGLAALFGIVAAGAAQAIQRDTIDLSYVYATANRTGNGDDTQFHGAFRVKTTGCLEMQWMDSAGSWHTSKFVDSNFNNSDPYVSCVTTYPNGRGWYMLDGLLVRGLRVTDGTRTATFCDTAAFCRALTT
jgi:hypothetical protein